MRPEKLVVKRVSFRFYLLLLILFLVAVAHGMPLPLDRVKRGLLPTGAAKALRKAVTGILRSLDIKHSPPADSVNVQSFSETLRAEERRSPPTSPLSPQRTGHSKPKSDRLRGQGSWTFPASPQSFQFSPQERLLEEAAKTPHFSPQQYQRSPRRDEGLIPARSHRRVSDPNGKSYSV